MLWFYPPPPAYMPPQQAIAAPSSSPLQLPSTQSSDMEVRASFFEWCIQQSNRRSEEEALKKMAETLGLQGFAVNGIGNAIVEEWKVTGLPIGYKRRPRVSAKS
jgi:hypothetical protein